MTFFGTERENDEDVSNVLDGTVEEEIDCLVPEDQLEVMKQPMEVTGDHNCPNNTSLASKRMEGDSAARDITDLLEDHEVLVTTTMGDADRA